MATKQFSTVDEYIATFSPAVQEILNMIRKILRDAVPEAEESISYQMPTLSYKGKYLVYYAGWKNHIGFYATPDGNEAFKKELTHYKGAKGSIQFPLTHPIPYNLIKKIALFRLEEVKINLSKN